MALDPSTAPGPESEAARPRDRSAARRAVRRLRARKLGTGLNVGAAALLAAALLAMVNYATVRYFGQRWNVSSLRHYTLSDKTQGMLRTLRGEIRITTLFQEGSTLGDEVTRLLQEYVQAADQIDGLTVKVEAVDPDRDLARTRELANQYDVTEANVVIVALEKRSRIIDENDLVDYDRKLDSSQLAATHRVRVEKQKRAFLGELAISSAIQGLAQSRQPTVYFLQGHGERDIEEFSAAAGYADVARLLRRDNIEVRPLVLPESGSVPEDCDALVIAGAERALSEAEVARLSDYLERSGRLLVLSDPGIVTGLEHLLEAWGVRLSRDVVIGLSLTGRELFIRNYNPHPITRPLQGLMTVFYTARSVETVAETAAAEKLSVDRPRAVALGVTQDGWAEYNLAQNPPRYDAGVDRPAPISVAVAVERGTKSLIDMQLRPTRMVVIGDSDFAANGALQNAVGGNADLLLSAMNWLLEREALMAISGKPPIDLRLDMDDRLAGVAFGLIVVALPAVVALLGVGVWFARRR